MCEPGTIHFAVRGEITQANDHKKRPDGLEDFVPEFLPIASTTAGEDGTPEYLPRQNEMARILAESGDMDMPSSISADTDEAGESYVSVANTGLRAKMANGERHAHDHVCWKTSNAAEFLMALRHFVPPENLNNAMVAAHAISIDAFAALTANNLLPNCFVSVVRAAEFDEKTLAMGVGGYRSVAYRDDRMEISPRVGAMFAFTSLSYKSAKGKDVRRFALYRASTVANPLVHNYEGKNLRDSHVTDTFSVTRAWATADGKWPDSGIIQVRHHAGDGVSIHFKYSGKVHQIVQKYLVAFDKDQDSSSSSDEESSSSSDEE